MEFYFDWDCCRFLRARFQFPTGWNSTKNQRLFFDICIGFNSQRDGILRLQTAVEVAQIWGFNSQRDGILRRGKILVYQPLTFQFPTGWNSTFCIWSWKCRFRCFNSQRDGILLKNGVDYYTLDKRFQFPTGWNSTNPGSGKTYFAVKFQFPTGWNSTQNTKAPEIRGQQPFQFPTGWNSTELEKLEHLKVICFNSQRDGILQHEFCYFSR